MDYIGIGVLDVDGVFLFNVVLLLERFVGVVFSVKLIFIVVSGSKCDVLRE